MNDQANTSAPGAAQPKEPKASATATTTAPTKAKEVKHIPPGTTVLAEHANNRHFCVAAPHTSPEDLHQAAEPFALIAERLARFDDIRVVSAEGEWLADFVVVDCGPGYAICHLVSAIELATRRSDMTDRIPEGFEIKQSAPGDAQPGWLVLRKADDVVLNAGQHHQRREDAVRFLLDHSTVRSASTSPLWHRS